jgi:hypothetical protein
MNYSMYVLIKKAANAMSHIIFFFIYEENKSNITKKKTNIIIICWILYMNERRISSRFSFC